MFPLLALGLLGTGVGGASLLQQFLGDRRNQAGAAQVQSLLGTAPQEMGPPTEAGVMGQVPGTGTGLLGNMGDPATQARFAAGLMALPAAQRQTASMMYDQLFQRMQQAGQFDRTETGINSRFAAQQKQGADEFGQMLPIHQGQLKLGQDNAATASAQWLKDFQLRQQEAQQRHDDAMARLKFERDQASAKAGAPNLPALPVGYGYMTGKDGKPFAAPVKGSPDWQKAAGEEADIHQGMELVNRYMDLIGGKEEIGPDGKAVRVGGTGQMYWTDAKKNEALQLRGAIIPWLGKRDSLGTMQKSDLDRVDALVPDPTSFSGAFTKPSAHMASYAELLRQMKVQEDKFYAAHPYMAPELPFDPSKGAPASSRSPSSPSGAGGAGVPFPVGAKSAAARSIWDRLNFAPR